MSTIVDHDALAAYWPHADAAERLRFAGSIYFREGDECWIWTGGLESDGGCTRFRSAVHGVIAGHRWSALAHCGPLSEPVVRHRCDVRCCVRPHHLLAGTQAQNVADTVRRGHWSSAARSGPRRWPELSYALRDAARAGDAARIDELLRRPLQLTLLPHPSDHPAAGLPSL